MPDDKSTAAVAPLAASAFKPMVHPECVCTISPLGVWTLGVSASGPCQTCIAARNTWNATLAGFVAMELEKKKTPERTDDATGPICTREAGIVERVIDQTTLVMRNEQGGEIEGYALTWTYDGDGFRFEKGSFAKCLRERLGKIPLMVRHLVHGTSVMDTVGWIVRAIEDDFGLKVVGEFLSDPFSQTIREKAMNQGIKAMSIAAKPLKYVVQAGVIIASEARAMEVTLTNIPADTGANVLAVREQPPAPVAVTVQPEPPAPPPVAADTPEDKCRRESTLLLLERCKCCEMNC